MSRLDVNRKRQDHSTKAKRAQDGSSKTPTAQEPSALRKSSCNFKNCFLVCMPSHICTGHIWTCRNGVITDPELVELDCWIIKHVDACFWTTMRGSTFTDVFHVPFAGRSQPLPSPAKRLVLLADFMIKTRSSCSRNQSSLDLSKGLHAFISHEVDLPCQRLNWLPIALVYQKKWCHCDISASTA